MNNSIKLICALMAVISSIFVLTSCSNCFKSYIFEDVTFAESFNSYGAILLSDEKAISDMISEYNFAALSSNAYDRLALFERDFFENNSIIIIFPREITGSSKLTVEKVEYFNNTVNVVLKRSVPSVANDQLKDYIIIVEIPQKHQYSFASYEVY